MNITSLNSGKSILISLINKAADFNMVTLLNKNWEPNLSGIDSMESG